MVAALLLAAAPCPAWADPPTAPDTSEAKAHFKRGKQLYDQGRYQQAIDQFESASDSRSDPAFDYDIAACYLKLGDLQNAQTYLEQTLAEAGIGSPWREPAQNDLQAVQKTIAEQQEDWADRHAPALWAGTASGALLLGAGLFGILHYADDQSLHNDPPSSPAAESDRSAAHRDGWIAVGLLAGGVVAAGAAGWLYVAADQMPAAGSQPTTVGFTVAPGLFTLSLSGRWGGL